MEPIWQCLIKSQKIGICSVTWGERGLTRVRLCLEPHDVQATRTAATANLAGPLPVGMGDVVERLRTYFSGTPVDFSSVRLDDEGLSDFNRAIYTALRRVSSGETTTYGDLARAAGFDAGAARAVGVVMGRNPWPVVVPCHRVMARGGKMGGFSAPGGAATKFKLLELEGARHTAAAPRLPGL